MLMRNERLAALRTDYDEASHTLTIHWRGPRSGPRRLANARRAGGHRSIFSPLHAGRTRGPPKVLSGEGP